MLRIFIIASFILIVSVTQLNAEESAVMLEYKLKEGDQATFKMNMGITMSGTALPGKINMVMEAKSTRIITQVAEDGLFNLIEISHVEIIQAKTNDVNMVNDIPATERDNWRISRGKISKDGRFVETPGTPNYSMPFDFSKSLLSSASLPDKPVKIGSSWVQSGKEKAIGPSVTYTLLGFETRNGYECAKIKGDMIGTLNMEGANVVIEKAGSTIYFALKEGMEVGVTLAAKMQMEAVGQKMAMDLNMDTQIQNTKWLTPENLKNTVNSLELLESGLNQLRGKEYDNAKTTFEEFLSKYKDSSFYGDVEKLMAKTNEPLMDKFRKLREQGNLEEMLKLAKESIKNNTEKRMILQELYWAYMQYNRIYELVPVFGKLVEENPNDTVLLNLLGQAYSNQNDYVKAIGIFEKAETLDPNDADIQSNLGGTYMTQGMQEKAIVSFKKALKLQPSMTFLYPQLAKAYFVIGKTDEALKLADELKQSIEKQEIPMDQAYAQVNLGDIYMAINHYDEAIEAFKKAVELDTNEMNARYFKEKLAQAYEGAGKPELAMEIRQTIPQNVTPMPSNEKIAPPFVLRDLENKEVKLSDFKGKAVILNFFATWAPQCKKQIAVLEELQKQYKEKEIVIIGVSVDRGGVDTIKSYIEKQKISYPIVISTQEMLDAYGEAMGKKIKELPTTLIINREGRIDFIQPGYLDKAVIENYIANLIGLATPVVPAERPKELKPTVRPGVPTELPE
jgi:tetratricopeptide (TPR) repeat protein